MRENINNSAGKCEKVLFAKSDMKTTLFIHTKDVINRIIEIYDNLPLLLKKIHGLKETAIVAAIFHDLGKSHPEFQKILRNQNNDWEKRRHEIISAVFFAYAIIQRWFKIKIHIKTNNISNSINSYLSLKKKWFILIFLSILFHHKYLIQNVDRKSSQFLTKSNHLSRIPIKGTLRPIILHKDFLALKVKYNEIYNFFENIEVFIRELNLVNLDFKFLKDNFPKKDDLFKDNIDISSFFLVLTLLNKDIENILIQDAQKDILTPDIRFFGSILLALIKTADHMGSMEIKPIHIPILNNFKLDDYTPYSFQEKVKEESNSVILRAPTGSGKTKAALFWAQKNQAKNSRLFYVLPFQASINAMFQRLSNFFNLDFKKKGSNIGIYHSKNLEFLSDYFSETDLSKESLFNPRQLKSLTKEVYYPIKVSTAHQLLRLSLFGKGWDTLLLELHESLIIFDEIHAYEPRILGMIIGLMKILLQYKVKFFIMTATIPNFIIELIRKEVFFENKDNTVSFVELNKHKQDDRNLLLRTRHKFILSDKYLIDFIQNENNLRIIINRYQKGYKQLFICNTVRSAQRLYEILINLNEFFDITNHIILFHSRFAQIDRHEIEKKVIMSEEKECNNCIKILIATQVVEVSLDIDYDFGYFEAAPIDALIQRMGRINRRCKNNIRNNTKPNIIIFEKAKHDKLIYNTNLVFKSINALKNLENIPITEFDLQSIVENVYPKFENDDQMEFDNGLHHYLIENHRHSMQIGLHKDWVFEIIENTDKMIEFIPREYLLKFKEYWKKKRYIDARKLQISSYYKRDWKRHLLSINKKNNFVLDHPNYKYDKKFGLKRID